jgi:hypothetical protein
MDFMWITGSNYGFGAHKGLKAGIQPFKKFVNRIKAHGWRDRSEFSHACYQWHFGGHTFKSSID